MNKKSQAAVVLIIFIFLIVLIVATILIIKFEVIKKIMNKEDKKEVIETSKILLKARDAKTKEFIEANYYLFIDEYDKRAKKTYTTLFKEGNLNSEIWTEIDIPKNSNFTIYSLSGRYLLGKEYHVMSKNIEQVETVIELWKKNEIIINSTQKLIEGEHNIPIKIFSTNAETINRCVKTNQSNQSHCDMQSTQRTFITCLSYSSSIIRANLDSKYKEEEVPSNLKNTIDLCYRTYDTLGSGILNYNIKYKSQFLMYCGSLGEDFIRILVVPETLFIKDGVVSSSFDEFVEYLVGC